MGTKNKVWLEKCRLGNYKSVIDLESSFRPGLNILIGKNGVGKTNFLRFLGNALDWESHYFSFEFCDLEFAFSGEKGERYVRKADDDSLSGWEAGKVEDPGGKVEIRFVPQRYQEVLPGLTNSLDFETSNSSEAFNLLRRRELPWFIKKLLGELILEVSTRANGGEGAEEIKIFIRDSVAEWTARLDLVSDYSPISEVRLSDELRVLEGKFVNSFKVAGLILEFKVGDRWFDFRDLSDGTQRIFLMMAELELAGSALVRKRPSDDLPAEVPETIFLIEEPELGVHPHQLHKIMEYLKERSQYSQLIISTHSPLVLNFLDLDELDRLVLCSVSAETGTQLRHLSEQEIKDALLYMGEQELFLSDYWVHSNLEPEF